MLSQIAIERSALRVPSSLSTNYVPRALETEGTRAEYKGFRMRLNVLFFEGQPTLPDELTLQRSLLYLAVLLFFFRLFCTSVPFEFRDKEFFNVFLKVRFTEDTSISENCTVRAGKRSKELSPENRNNKITSV